MAYENKFPLVQVFISEKSLKIYFDDLLHLMVDLKKIYGFQSWKEENVYRITYYMTSDKSISCTYYNEKTWSAILEQLNTKFFDIW